MKTTLWYLAPAHDLGDWFSAGAEGNLFGSRELAEETIPGLREAFRGGDGDIDWVAVEISTEAARRAGVLPVELALAESGG